MKRFSVLFMALLSLMCKGQYNSLNVNFISLIAPNTSTVISPVGNKYSGCWGWYQQSKNKEYGISGASNGTYFVDITNPSTPSVSAFLPGKTGATWREIKTYKNYCYIASDDAKPNKFQIVDMQYLPDSVHLVHDSNTLFERGHTLWVDSNRLYVGGISFSVGTSPMAIFSLATPSAPVLIKKLDDDVSTNIINYVHDMYARHDTIFASTGTSGLFVLKFNPVTNTVTVLGSYTGYASAGYNHSSFLTKNGKYLMFCDEVPASLPIHMVDVQNLNNIQPLETFYPAPQTTPHNPYMLGNNFAIVSCYQDGLFIYDISQPQNIKQVGFFDTYPQGGVNSGTYTSNTYAGNWGAYPFLPSGLIVANDMQNGMFVLNAKAAYTATVKSNVDALGVKQQTWDNNSIKVYPNPASNNITLGSKEPFTATIEIRDLTGRLVLMKSCEDKAILDVNVEPLQNGLYFVSVTGSEGSTVKKIQVLH